MTKSLTFVALEDRRVGENQAGFTPEKLLTTTILDPLLNCSLCFRSRKKNLDSGKPVSGRIE
jgi:hypothetical protein